MPEEALENDEDAFKGTGRAHGALNDQIMLSDTNGLSST